MPDELQLLPPDKTREVDPSIRTMLLETIVALGSTRQGREYMRSISVYSVLKMLNLVEKNDEVLALIDEAVNLLCRDEPDADPAPNADGDESLPTTNADGDCDSSSDAALR